MNIRPEPAARLARDPRVRALALTVLAVFLGGLALARLGGDTGRVSAPLPAPDSRTRPAEHAAAQREKEVERRFSQGVVMLHAREYEHAATAFHRVLEIAPDMPEAHVNMGFAMIGLQRHAAARDFFEGALALRRGQANAYYGLAVALEGLDDRAGAIGAMRTYVHLTAEGDPYRRKAQAALWEWEAVRTAEPREGRTAKRSGDAAHR